MSLIVSTIEFEIIEKGLNEFGVATNFVLVDWNSFLLVDLSNTGEIDSYLMRMFK